MSIDTNTAEKQAKAQLDSIITIVDRLDHARECDGKGCSRAKEDYHDEDAAEYAIMQHHLSVLVRSGWDEPMLHTADYQVPVEYEIVLCTGGPAVRIRGELNDGEPTDIRLEYQDWGTPWAQYLTPAYQYDSLLAYAQHFWYGA